MVKALHDSKAEACIQIYIRQRLSNGKVVGPEWQPNADDTRFAELLLEKTLYRNDLHMIIAHDARTPEEIAALDKKVGGEVLSWYVFSPGTGVLVGKSLSARPLASFSCQTDSCH